jgi:hypothetical protein
MKNWESYIYGFSGSAMGALGLLFIILGGGCILGSCAAFFMLIKKRAGYKLM